MVCGIIMAASEARNENHSTVTELHVMPQVHNNTTF